MKARLCGLGFCAAGHADLGAWARGEAPDPEWRPRGELLPSRLRRRTSQLTRMVCDVLQAAAAEGGADLSCARLILSTAWGELDTTVQILTPLALHEPVSPTLFHSSVHNTALGYVSIAAHNREGAGTLGAGSEGLFAGLLEALSLLAVEGGEVLLAVADEAIPPPFEPSPGDGIAAALCLRRLDDRRPGARAIQCELGRGPCPPVERVPATLASNPSAALVPLLRAVAAGAPARIPLGPAVAAGYFLDLRPAEAT